MTDSFTWEELPTRDPDTGYLTNAGLIPIIQSLSLYIPAITWVFHIIQSTIRMVFYHDMIYTNWYPFDASASPVFELANFTQVMFKLHFVINYRTHNFFKNLPTIDFHALVNV
jgi:hypothetical protein